MAVASAGIGRCRRGFHGRHQVATRSCSTRVDSLTGPTVISANDKWRKRRSFAVDQERWARAWRKLTLSHPAMHPSRSIEKETHMAEQTSTAAAKPVETQKAPARAIRPYEEMERMFEDFLSRGWLRPFRERMSELSLPWEGKMPKVDVVERDNEVVVRAEVPGVNKEDLEISVTGNLFTIRGHTRREEKEEKGDYYRCEVSQGSFSRTVTLPAEVTEAGAKAQLKDGMLEVTLGKAEQAKKRAIKID
jgi:HSP20 family protein